MILLYVQLFTRFVYCITRQFAFVCWTDMLKQEPSPAEKTTCLISYTYIHMNCYLNLKKKELFDKIDIILSVVVCFLT